MNKNTRILIVEDEEHASKRLIRLIRAYDESVDILGICDSVEMAISFLKNNPKPDLIFLDIQLGDGLCFDIFKEVEVNCPVIFTTAYDEYALKAFDLNSIDYLLKPINEANLRKSFSKFERLHSNTELIDLQSIIQQIGKQTPIYKKRFLIVIADKMVSLSTAEIAYFWSTEKSTFIVDFKGMHYAIDNSLDKIEEQLDPAFFFRINRQFIISSSCIEKMILLSKSRIKLRLNPETKEDILVSSARTHTFKTWLDK